MNAEKALKEAVDHPDFLSISGSRLYGTARPESDFDYRGFVVPPFEYLVGDRNFNDTELPGADHKVYALKRFLHLEEPLSFFGLILTNDTTLPSSFFL